MLKKLTVTIAVQVEIFPLLSVNVVLPLEDLEDDIFINNKNLNHTLHGDTVNINAEFGEVTLIKYKK